MAELAIASPSPDSLVDTLFLRTLSRYPKADERNAFVTVLSDGFDTRLVASDRVTQIEQPPLLPKVTWFNHGRPQANEIQLEIERRVLAGPPPDPRLSPAWRSVLEDVLWSLINHREFVWIP